MKRLHLVMLMLAGIAGLVSAQSGFLQAGPSAAKTSSIKSSVNSTSKNAFSHVVKFDTVVSGTSQSLKKSSSYLLDSVRNIKVDQSYVDGLIKKSKLSAGLGLTKQQTVVVKSESLSSACGDNTKAYYEDLCPEEFKEGSMRDRTPVSMGGVAASVNPCSDDACTSQYTGKWISNGQGSDGMSHFRNCCYVGYYNDELDISTSTVEAAEEAGESIFTELLDMVDDAWCSDAETTAGYSQCYGYYDDLYGATFDNCVGGAEDSGEISVEGMDGQEVQDDCCTKAKCTVKDLNDDGKNDCSCTADSQKALDDKTSDFESCIDDAIKKNTESEIERQCGALTSAYMTSWIGQCTTQVDETCSSGVPGSK